MQPRQDNEGQNNHQNIINNMNGFLQMPNQYPTYPIGMSPPSFYPPSMWYGAPFPQCYPQPFNFNMGYSIQQPVPQMPTQLSVQENIQDDQSEQKPIIKIVKCQCNKSNCMKQYCLCYKQGQPCGQKCNCTGCKNKKNATIIRSQKKRKNKQSIKCNCTKSRCQKKYCECYTVGKKCSDKCSCINCHN